MAKDKDDDGNVIGLRPCRAWAIKGANVCGAHGGRAPQVRRAADERAKEAIRSAVLIIAEGSPKAAETLVKQASGEDPDTGANGRRQAAESVLKFALKDDTSTTKVDIDVTVRHEEAQQRVRATLDRYAADAGSDVVDAEIVDE